MSKITLLIISALLVLDSLAIGADSTSVAAPKSKRVALTRSLVWTLLPAAVGGAMMLHGQRVSPINFGQGSGQTNDNETIIGLGIGSLGIVFGPGAGHAYAGRMGKFWGGAAIRGLVAPLAFAGALGIAFSSESGESAVGGIVLVAGAGALFLTSVVYDIATAGRSVDMYNHSHGFSDMRITPTYFACHKTPGLVFTLSF
jgi:hypothetical protein